jgi:hypothetical protein
MGHRTAVHQYLADLAMHLSVFLHLLESHSKQDHCHRRRSNNVRHGNQARCGRSQARKRSQKGSVIAEGTWTGDSTWRLRDTKPRLIYYYSGSLRNVLEHGGMGSQDGRIVWNAIEADGRYW